MQLYSEIPKEAVERGGKEGRTLFCHHMCEAWRGEEGGKRRKENT